MSEAGRTGRDLLSPAVEVSDCTWPDVPERLQMFARSLASWRPADVGPVSFPDRWLTGVWLTGVDLP
jgi:hypothetical protein